MHATLRRELVLSEVKKHHLNQPISDSRDLFSLTKDDSVTAVQKALAAIGIDSYPDSGGSPKASPSVDRSLMDEIALDLEIASSQLGSSAPFAAFSIGTSIN